jgi:hypothetical protein
MSTTTRQPNPRVTGWARPSRSRAIIPTESLRRRSIISPDSSHGTRVGGRREEDPRRGGSSSSTVRFRSEKTGVIHSTSSELSNVMADQPLSPPLTPHAATSTSANELENELISMDTRSFLTTASDELYHPLDTSSRSMYRGASVESGDDGSGPETVVADTGLATVTERVRAPSPPPARLRPASPTQQEKRERWPSTTRRRVSSLTRADERSHHASQEARQLSRDRASPAGSTAYRGTPLLNTLPNLSKTLLAHLQDRLTNLEAHLLQVEADIAYEQTRQPTLREPHFLPQLFARREDVLWRVEGVFGRYADVVKASKALGECGGVVGVNGARKREEGVMGSLDRLLEACGIVELGHRRVHRESQLRPQVQYCLLAAFVLSLITSLMWRVSIVLVVGLVTYGGPRVRPMIMAAESRLEDGLSAFVASMKIAWNDVSSLRLDWPDEDARERWKWKGKWR